MAASAAAAVLAALQLVAMPAAECEQSRAPVNASVVPLPPSRLLVEHAASPVRGIDTATPRFSWHVAVSSHSRRVAHVAYRLQVCAVPVRRAAPWDGVTWECDEGCEGGSCVWDSGRVNASRSWNVRLGSTAPLPSDATLAWRVMWWAGKGGGEDCARVTVASAFSDVATFDTGLVGGVASLPGGAEWIGPSQAQFDAARLGTTQLRTEFSLPGGAVVTRARAFVACPGYCTLRVNGQRASDAVLGAFTVFTRRTLYDVVDVTPLLESVPPVANGKDVLGGGDGRESGNGSGSAGGIGGTTDDTSRSDDFAAVGGNDPLQQQQQHALAVTLANGWYSQPTVALGPRKFSMYLNLSYALPGGAHGSVAVVTRASSWVATTGPTTLSDIYLGAAHDTALETPGWDRPRYNASAAGRGRWAPATALPSPLLPGVGVLRAQVMPPVRRVETFAPVATTHFPATAERGEVWVVDFGQNMAGMVELMIPASVLAAAAPGAKVTLRHAEAVYPNGSLHHLYGARVAEAVTYIVGPRGPTVRDVVYEPDHTYFGFRYVEIGGDALAGAATTGGKRTGTATHTSTSGSSTSGNSGGTTATTASPQLPVRVVAHLAHSDLERTGRITTSSDVLNRVVHAATYSQLSTWTSVPTGCTQRERRGWLGDAQLASEGQMHTVFAAPAYAKFLDDIADTQADEWGEHGGSVPEVCPNYGHGANPPDPPFGVGFAVIWWNQYRYYGDADALAGHYDGVKAFAETLVARAGGSGERAGVLNASASTHGDWVSVANKSRDATTCSGRAALDHHANTTCCLFMECPGSLVSGVYYVLQLRIVAAAAGVLGRGADAARYAALARSAASLLATVSCRNRSVGHVGHGYQADLALALSLGSPGGVVPPEDVGAVAAALAGDVAARGGHLTTGIFGTKALLPALSAHGFADAAVGVLTQTTVPGWGAWVTRFNATTLFEMWGAFDGEPPASGTASRNHVMFSSFVPWLYQVVAGVAMDVGSDWGTSVLPPPPLSAMPSLSSSSSLSPSSSSSSPAMPAPGAVVGFETFRVAPRLVRGLTWVNASVVTMRGMVAVAVARSAVSVAVDVSIPPGADTPVTVPLPLDAACDAASAEVREGGALVWSRGAAVPGVSGVVGAVAAVLPDAGVVVTVGSGDYRFVAACVGSA